MKAVILAAGKGKRLESEAYQIPKALRQANGLPLLHYVVNAIDFIDKDDITIVVGLFKEMIMEHTEFKNYNFAVQTELLGTGHAAKSAKEYLKDYSGDVMILCGDTPLLDKTTLQNMYEFHKSGKKQCTILSCRIAETLSIGRIARNENGTFADIVENKDATEEQKKIREYNTGVMIADAEKFFEELENLQPRNAQGEYYLTDVPKLFLNKNYKVGVYTTDNQNEILGVNSMEDLELVENILKGKK